MAHDYLNKTTFSDDVAQQEGILSELMSRMSLPQEESSSDDDLVEILDSDDELEELNDEEVQQTDPSTHDFENEESSASDNAILSYLFSEKESPVRNTYTDADTVFASDENGENINLSWLNRKSKNVNLGGLNSNLSKYLVDLPDDIKNNLTATSGNDQEHATNSKHYNNNALDLRYNDKAYKYILNDPKAKEYGINMLNPNHGTAKHIHLETKQVGGDVTPMEPVTVHGFRDKETRGIYDKIHNYDDNEYYALMKLGEKYGFSKINEHEGIGTASYNALTDTSHIYKDGSVKHNYDDKNKYISFEIGDIVSELPHRIQFKKDPIGSAYKWFDRDLLDYITSKNPYIDPKTLEYDAHTTIGDKIDEEYEDYINAGLDTPSKQLGGFIKNKSTYSQSTPNAKFGGNMRFNTGSRTLIADNPAALMKGLNNNDYNKAVLKLSGTNPIRGLDSGQPVAVTDGSKYKILRGPNDMANFTGNVYEQRI